MTRLTTRIAAPLIALVALAGAAFADPIEGLWQTEVDDGAYALVTIAPCGSAYCGVISRTFNAGGEYQAETIGRQIVIDMVPQGGNAYEGQVWRPSNDKIYLGKVDVNGDRMQLRGCVAGGLFCASQTWARVG
ncbi:DUF2147 domain-containing protein [Pseudoroseicyclus tamaricis]|uniref:DUF2147 domain-containing protein n=1 Tax=Pseudoroseicyclus tamaricis TaxID=2705421 RepID=A0A6B2JQ61_9RHOB|nr:DUF2147 domain-containing protein [Pseudoroseicyclus tamaricis]NDV00160.1 DUF2147 domain-containing protein [Pseudoroseicyclus tamaricis]